MPSSLTKAWGGVTFGLGFEEGGFGCTERVSGRRVRGQQTEAESRSRHREQLEFLFGWNFLDVSRLARAAAVKESSGHTAKDLG